MDLHKLMLAHLKYSHVHYKKLLENDRPKGYERNRKGESPDYEF